MVVVVLQTIPHPRKVVLLEYVVSSALAVKLNEMKAINSSIIAVPKDEDCNIYASLQKPKNNCHASCRCDNEDIYKGFHTASCACSLVP